MKIAVVANPSTPHVMRWIDALEQRGHTVGIFVPAGLDYECDRDVHEFGRASESGIRATLRRAIDLGRQMRDFDADVVHAHFVLNYGTWAVLSRVRPVVVSALGSDLFIGPKHSLASLLKVTFTLRGADAVTFNSAELGRVARRLGARKSRLQRIVFGVDPDVFELKELADVNAPIRFLSTRQLKPLYRIDDVVRAFAKAEFGDSAQLIISSAGPEADRLRATVVALGIDDTVHFTGRVSDQEMIKLYRSSDVYISVPESDSSSVSLLEAMSCGLTAVASDLPANREWVGSCGEGGVLVEVGDVSALAAVLRSIARDREALATMGRRNRDLVMRKANWHVEVTKMETLFQRLAQEEFSRFSHEGED